MKFFLLFLMTAGFLPQAMAVTSSNLLEENLYQEFQDSILSQNKMKQLSSMGFSQFEQSLYVDALWDLVDEQSPEAIEALGNIELPTYDLTERLRLAILKLKNNRILSLPTELKKEVENALHAPRPDLKLLYTIAAYEPLFLKAGYKSIVELAKKHPEYSDVADEEKKNEISDDMIYDLFHHTPDMSTYMNGEYLSSVKLFMFCRDNRLYPCLIVMKNIHGEPVKNADGKLWTHRSLASSKHGLPSYARNGNTPAGIFTIDSVMPVADAPIAYGKNRRMVLNLIPKSPDEVLFKSLLPPSSQQDDWWKTSVTARDIGRNLFRIHGTGKINTDKNTPYFPFMRTSGCIAQRENTYDGIKYNDQRIFLDSIMQAMDLKPSFENELKIKGVLYIVELDDKNAPVNLEDLTNIGIQ